MSYEDKPGTGGLWANKKRESNTQPNATGYIVAHRDIRAGERLRLAAWTKEGRDGGRWQSLKLSDERGRRDEPREEPPAADPFSDDVPF